ncbi:hypothetical protein THAOC_21385, partial [Thalassiosira oceanica]
GFRVRERVQLGLPPELTGYLTDEEEQGLVSFLVEAGKLRELPETFGTAIISLMERYGILSRYSALRTASRLREAVYLERFMEKERDAAVNNWQDDEHAVRMLANGYTGRGGNSSSSNWRLVNDARDLVTGLLVRLKDDTACQLDASQLLEWWLCETSEGT